MGCIRDRIDDSQLESVESAEVRRTLRTDASNALGRAPDESPAQPLSRTVVSNISQRLSSPDWQLGQIDRDVAPDGLDDIIVDYYVAIVIAYSTAEGVPGSVMRSPGPDLSVRSAGSTG